MIDITPLSQSDAKKLFAEFGVRMAAVVFDFFIVIFLALGLQLYIIDPIGMSMIDQRAIMLVLFPLYFSLFWSSRMQATPAQYVFGMRVVTKDGQRLDFRHAFLRGALLIALLVASLTLMAVPGKPIYGVVAFSGLALFFLAAVTPNRQGGHDLLSKSMVVNRIVLKSPEYLEQLLAHVSDSNPATRIDRQPAIWRMIVDLLVLAVPVVILIVTAQIQYDRDLRYRTGYAVREAGVMKSAVEEFYRESTRWPTNEEELGMATRGDYPDGGYYQLEGNGVIRIHFTVKPELMNGSIVLSPSAGIDGITWACYSEGQIAKGYLHAWCRD